LQSAAPVDGILVDETTYRATNRMIEYRPSESVTAKGKEQPVLAWEALEARSRYGVDTTQAPRAPLIGRERELDVLVDALARVRQERSPQLVTLAGVPGIGKTRLVYELFQAVEADPDIIYWRQGRSLPYGEGVSFWALGEMVKAHAGILETDLPEDAARKLHRSVGDLLDESDADWVTGHLEPLVGVGAEQDLHGDRRSEAFAAWRRFFEGIAEERPLVLVFEDLHWADEGLLDFVDHLVDWAGGFPILVVCTARPELLSRRAGWGGGKPNAATLSLSPLDDDQTARLLAALLERAVLPAETQMALLQRAGGNPLYAEEFVRMVGDRGVDAEGGELPLPESVQGIVAARLDGLPENEKALLQDAAVIGKVFWLGAACAIRGLESSSAEDDLHRLERKEFVRRERRSSMAGETEYAFRHLLVRDVAYGQIPRAHRAEKHRVAAEWIEASGRLEDSAELLAHHYLTALELAGAAGRETTSLTERARLALREAGDRASGLSAYPAARRFYRAAVELWPADDPGRPDLLLRYGRAINWIEATKGFEVVTEARDAFLVAGDAGTAAEAEMLLAEAFWLQGQRDRAFERIQAAEALVADHPTTASKAFVLSNVSRFAMLAGEKDKAIRVGRDALAMADELALDVTRSHALNNIGTARVATADKGGLDDLEESIAIALAANSPEAIRGHGNLASVLMDLGQVERAFAHINEGRQVAERFGVVDHFRWLSAEALWELYFDGRWDDALRGLDDLIAEFTATQFWMETPCRWLRGRIRLARGDTDGAQADASRAVELARLAKDPQVLWPALAFGARAYCGSDRRRANDLAGELLSEWKAQQVMISGSDAEWTNDLIAVLPPLGRENEFLEAGDAQLTTPWRRAAKALFAGDFGSAAETYATLGALPEEAYVRLRWAEALVAQGRRAAADAELHRSLGFWRGVGATAYVREGEALLAESA
jgi:tetratricopeptide (TPR) repeat protein